jgi:hypothetical protein
LTRRRVILGPSGAYWVRAGTRSRLPVLAAPWAAELLVATVAYFRAALAFRLYAWTVLPDALEAVIQPSAPASGRLVGGGGSVGSTAAGGGDAVSAPPPANISKVMMEIKGSFAYWYNRRLGRRGNVWEKRFKDRILLTAEEIRAAALAVHSRPASLGLAESPELYPYYGLSRGGNPVALIDPLPVKCGGLPVRLPARRSA